jgi:acyl-CoA thioesterase
MGEMAGSTGPHNVKMQSWISCAPFEQLLQMHIIEASEGFATLKMPFLVDFAQGSGLMHGGALVGLADTAAAIAIKSVIPAGTQFVTVSLRAEFLHAVKLGVVTAKAKVTCQGGAEWKGEVSVFDEAGKVVVELSSVFKVLRGV